MHCIPDTAISYHYTDDNDILHHFNELASFLCMNKILRNFREHVFKDNYSVAATEYKTWDTKYSKKEVKFLSIHSITNKPNAGDFFLQNVTFGDGSPYSKRQKRNMKDTMQIIFNLIHC